MCRQSLPKFRPECEQNGVFAVTERKGIGNGISEYGKFGRDVLL